MHIFIPNESKQTLGGGFTFIRNFTKYAERSGARVSVGSEIPVDAEILFIAGATMVRREMVVEARAKGMKIVLRVDNAPRNSRNRNTGTSRLRDFASMADMIVFQSEWAKGYLDPFLQADVPMPVILNGADPEIFYGDGPAQPKEGMPQYLYAQYNRDETKQWHQAWYEFSMLARGLKNAHLWIVGNFSAEIQQYGFDFFMGERFTYTGVLDNPADFAEYLRATDTLLLPYYNDACSNVLIEARLCGVTDIKHNGTGGNNEIMDAPLHALRADYMAGAYLTEFSNIV